MELLVESAEKLGFDRKDLADFGFDLDGSACGRKMCFKKENIKGYYDLWIKTDKAVKDAQQNLIDKVKCHPFVSKHVLPKVQFWWHMFPFDLLCFNVGTLWTLALLIYNPFGICINIFIFTPFYVWVVLPWNISCYTIAGFICPWFIFLLTTYQAIFG